jgi:hypothetical protein
MVKKKENDVTIASYTWLASHAQRSSDCQTSQRGDACQYTYSIVAVAGW